MMDFDWSSLPPELLEKIVKGLTVITDYVRFRAVCRSWQLAAPPPKYLPSQIPWLMLSSNEDTPKLDTKYSGNFYSLSDHKIYRGIELPDTRRFIRRCFGSSHGWLSFVDYNTANISLFNPITKARIQLPHITTIPGCHYMLSGETDEIEYHTRTTNPYSIYDIGVMAESCIHKFCLSETPTSSDNYIAIIIHSEQGRMAFCRAGDDKWWSIIKNDMSICDGIYHKGQFYGVDGNGRLTICNLDPCDPKEKTIGCTIDCVYTNRKYLVEVSGELMMVIRHIRRGLEHADLSKTKGFHVYRFVPTSEKWVRVRSLDDNTLFLGMNCSFSISAKDVHSEGCKRNCIYFSDDSGFRRCDLGIFNLEDGSIEPLPCYAAKRLRIWPPPMWITPSLS